jgi:hypothetical protein
MTTHTTLLNLAKSEAADLYNTTRTDNNSNADILEAQVKKCYVGTLAPTSGDDSGDGYSIGSKWVQTVGPVVYVCTDASVGAAVWRQVWPTLAAYVSTLAPTSANDSSEGYSIGSIGVKTVGPIGYVCTDASVGAAVWRQVWPVPAADYVGTLAPTSGDDSGDGYSIGSKWVQTVGPVVYVCTDASVGAAYWRQVWPIPSAYVTNAMLAGSISDANLATSYLTANGSRGLSAAWDAGSWQIRAETFQSDVATGAAPLVVASTTLVANLHAANSDALNSLADTAFVKKTDNGWVAAPALTYAAADAPSYTVTITGDYSAIIMAGMRVMLTDSTVKYFICTKSTYSAPNTTLTLYGGTDYTLSGGAISAPFYSMMKAPAGFPLSPAKWTVTVTDTSDRSQATPTGGVWYNVGSMLISVPIGAWRLQFSVYAYSEVGAGPFYNIVFICLSTSNNSQSNSALYRLSNTYSAIANIAFLAGFANVVTTSKTSYYLNGSVGSDKAPVTLHFHNDYNAMILEAICAYL